MRGGINLYSYVVNNPVNLIDPFGLCEESSLFGKAKVLWDKAHGWYGTGKEWVDEFLGLQQVSYEVDHAIHRGQQRDPTITPFSQEQLQEFLPLADKISGNYRYAFLLYKPAKAAYDKICECKQQSEVLFNGIKSLFQSSDTRPSPSKPVFNLPGGGNYQGNNPPPGATLAN